MSALPPKSGHRSFGSGNIVQISLRSLGVLLISKPNGICAATSRADDSPPLEATPLFVLFERFIRRLGPREAFIYNSLTI
jgi:hypothetical protein